MAEEAFWYAPAVSGDVLIPLGVWKREYGRDPDEAALKRNAQYRDMQWHRALSLLLTGA